MKEINTWDHRFRILNNDELNHIEDNELTPELSEEQKLQYLYSKSYYDLEFFSSAFLSHIKQKNWELIDTPYFHKEIWMALDSWENVNCIIARWHGKTTAVLIWILHALIYSKAKSILYIASAGLWEESIGKLKQELETNEELKTIYWELIPEDKATKKEKQSKKWRQRELELLNWSRIQTLSKWMTVRWKRPDKIIFDDPQENKDVENKKIVEKFNKWVFSSLYNTLLPWGSMVALWTIIWNLCLVKHLKEEKNWITIQYEACDDNFDNILWSDMWSKESLIQRKRDIWSAIFNQEFRNIALSKAETVIKEYWIRYWELLPDEFDNIIMAIDPAISEKESADYTWISVAWFKNDKIYIIYAKQHKLSPQNFKQMIHSLNDKFKPNKIIYEKNKEEYMGQVLSYEDLPMELIHAHKDKRTRLLSVAWKIEFWEVYFSRGMDELIYQLTNFPDIEHDDIMDSAVYCLMNIDSDSGSNIEIM